MRGKFSVKKFFLYCFLMVIVLMAGGSVFLHTYDFSRFSARITRQAETMLGRKVTVGGEVRLKLGMRPRIVLEKVALKNASWGARGHMAQAERIELRTRLLPLFLGRVEVTHALVVKPDILLEKSRSGRWNIWGNQRKGAQKQTSGIAELGFETLEIRDGTVTYRDHGTNKTHRVLLERFFVSRKGPGDSVQLEVEARYKEKPFLVRGTVGSLWRIADPDVEWPLNLNVDYWGTTLELSGGIKDLQVFRGFCLDFSAKGSSVQHMIRLAGYKPLFMGKFRFSGRLTDPAKHVYKISKMELELAENQFAGSAEIDLSKDRPSLFLDVRSRKMNVRRLYDAKIPRRLGHARKGRVLPDIPIPLAGLDKINLKMKLSARKVHTQGPVFRDFHAELNLKDGHLTVKPIKAHIGEGTLQAELEIQSANPKPLISVSLDMEKVSIKNIRGKVKGGIIPEGTISADIAVSGQGLSTGPVMAGLQGEVKVAMQKGLIQRKWLETTGARASTDISGLFKPQEGQGSHVSVNCLVCAFEIQKGKAKSWALFLDTPDMVVVGDGEVDLETEQIDFSLNQVSKDGIGFGVSGVGSIGLNVSNLAEPFKISGTLGDPSLTVDTADAILTIGKIAGGIVLFGPLGIAAALIDTDVNDIQSCEDAIERSEKGVPIKVEEDGDVFYRDIEPGWDP